MSARRVRRNRADHVIETDGTVVGLQIERRIARRTNEKEHDPVPGIGTVGADFVSTDARRDAAQRFLDIRRFAGGHRIGGGVGADDVDATVPRAVDLQRPQARGRQNLLGANRATVIEAHADLIATRDLAPVID